MPRTETPMTVFSESGFTLTEVLVALAIAAVVGALAATSFSSYQTGFGELNQAATLEQDLSGAMYLMEREIRMAGYDPTRSAGAGVLFGSGQSSTVKIVFSADIEGGSPEEPWNGDINTTEEITYALFDYGDPPRSALGRSIRGGKPQLVARFVDSLRFEYWDVDGNPALFPDEVREVTIELGGSTQNEGLNRRRVLNARVPVKNNDF